MKIKEYLNSKLITISFLIIGGLILAVFTAISRVNLLFITVIFLFYLLIISTWLIIDYITEKHKIEKLSKLIEELPDKYLVGEILPKPDNTIERRYYNIMKEVSRSAIGAVKKAEQEKENYCNYVESWIHEIKTPLTAISLIIDNGSNISKLKSELKRADNLTESILYYARLRTAEKDLLIQELNVSNIIEDAVKSQMELLISSHISVKTQGNFKVYSDSKILIFIINQFLINCAKYCPDSTITITASNGLITIKDNGIGIPTHDLSRLKERGFTGENGRIYGNSTGMGLFIANELCKNLNIEMSIDSVQNEYTEITLKFSNLT